MTAERLYPLPHPLVELSSCVDPSTLRHPVAREAVIQATLTLRKHLRGERWPLPYQIAAVAYCALAKDRVLVADEQGVGKTPVGLLRILLGGLVPAVVVAPASMLLKWKEESEIWLPGIEVHRLDRVDRFVPQRGWRGIVVTTWDLLRYHSDALARLKPRIVIGDECHYILNEGVERAVHFECVARASPRLLLLSGTPIKNHAKELWRLLHLLDPRAWPEHTQRAFKELNKEDFDKGVQSRLTHRIRQYMLRRVKTEAMPDLAAKQYQFLDVRLPDADMKLYLQVEKEFSDWLGAKVRAEVEAEGLDLQDDELEAEIVKRMHLALAAQNLVQFGHLRRLVGRLKARVAADWIVEAAQARESVVVFAEHQEVISLIGAALARRRIKYGVIDGKTTKTRRHSLVKEFQDKKIIDVLLCSSAAKEGLTLHRARHVLFAERFLTAAAEDQAADRLHRLGQKRDVRVWIMRALETVDVKVDQIVSRKRRISGRTVDARQISR